MIFEKKNEYFDKKYTQKIFLENQNGAKFVKRLNFHTFKSSNKNQGYVKSVISHFKF